VIRRLFRALPGSPPLRVVQMVVVAALLVAALVFVYDWVGGTFLDSGGTMG
jgi:hypothetical protein